MAIRYAIFLFLACALDPRTIISSDAVNVNITGILEELLSGYDKRIRPNHGGPPVEVGVTMFILNIEDVSESEMDFTIDFYFRQFWTDTRLSFSSDTETIALGSDFADKIWLPDTFFANEKQSYAHSVTSNNEFIRIRPYGTLGRSVRMTVTASCPMNLQYFPMDTQLCYIEIESFGHTTRDIRYKWNAGLNSVGVSSEASLPQFKLVGYRQKTIEISLNTGNYSRLAVQFQFVRSIGHHLLQFYIPSGMIVILSWVSFWLNRNATTARVLLGIFTILAEIAIAYASNVGLPKVSYVKSIDLYLGICCFMVFASLLEYATIGYITKKNQFLNEHKFADKKKADLEAEALIGEEGNGPTQGDKDDHTPKEIELQLKVQRPNILSEGDTTGSSVKGERDDEEAGVTDGPDRGIGDDLSTSIPQESPEEENGRCIDINKMYAINPSNLDKYSRIIFPICFICFNLLYWLINLRLTKVVPDDLILLEDV